MSATLPGLSTRVRRRILLVFVMAGMGVALAVAAIAWRAGGFVPAVLAAALVLVAGLVLAWPRMQRRDVRWAASALDAAHVDLEDSTALLLADDAQLGPLQRLQRQRVAQRLARLPDTTLLPPWPWRRIAGLWLVAVVTAALALAWPVRDPAPPPAVAFAPGGLPAAAPALQSATVHIQPPAYTGQVARKVSSLDAKAPSGARIGWGLRLAPQPAEVELVAHDGTRIALHRDGDDWRGQVTLSASMLYRVVADGVPLQVRPHRIDAISDDAPSVFLRQPLKTLTLVDRLPPSWDLVFDAEDDHGVSGDAVLVVTRSEGTGENIRFHDTSLRLRGSGEQRHKRFQVRIVPAAYGLQRGEDLVARLEVRDNRAPVPQSTRSASAILRWPEAPVIGADGLDALARQVLPAYFRSQRQIIIDAEALREERGRLADDAFATRSDALGVDQRLLRLRYGQFLGEESEGARPLPTSDLPTSDTPVAPPHDHAGEDAHAHAHGEGAAGAIADGEDASFGRADDVLEAFGHTHDIPEAATLLDPETRETLRKALREMWQSELHLRQGAPQTALPYAHRALEFIKQVQQAERIYLQRVGTQLPPIDESRRMTGKRDGIERRGLAPAPARAADPLRDAWLALDGDSISPALLDQLQAWARHDREGRVDPLSLIAVAEALRADPRCGDCRVELRALLWAAMSRPAGGAGRRGMGGATGQRYLELIGKDAEGTQ